MNILVNYCNFVQKMETWTTFRIYYTMLKI